MAEGTRCLLSPDQGAGPTKNMSVCIFIGFFMQQMLEQHE